MSAVKSQKPADVLDTVVAMPTSPYKPLRDTFPTDMDRIQSGGLSDDPTESGAPVQNRKSFKNLTGGR